MAGYSRGNFKKPDDYTDLGYANYWGGKTPDLLKKCNELKHQKRHVDNSLFANRGIDDIYICDECKILYHIDSSD